MGSSAHDTQRNLAIGTVVTEKHTQSDRLYHEAPRNMTADLTIRCSKITCA